MQRIHRLLFFIVSACLYLATAANSTIIEINYIGEIFTYVNSPSDFIIFDIDETTATSLTPFGGDIWFCHQLEQLIHSGMSREQAIEDLLPLYTFVQHQIDLKPVEPCTAACIKALQEYGFHVFGLSTRNISLASRTVNQLAALNISFINTNVWPHDFEFSVQGYPCMYLQGIIFGSGGHKGEILKHFFAYTGHAPNRIIIINDKQKHLETIIQAYKDMNIECIGLRYGHLDAVRTDYCPEEHHALEAMYRTRMQQNY